MKLRKMGMIAATLLLLGGGVGLAAVLTTGTASVCATATTPAHTIKVDATPVYTIAGAGNTQCVTTTYTVPTVTQTVTQTVTTTPTATPVGGWGFIQLGDGHLANITPAHLQAANVVIVSVGGDASTAAALPGRSYVYMDAMLVRNDGGSGVDYATAQSLGYLTGTNSTQYPATYAKIDSAAYQQWFGQQAVALVKKYGVDGIWLDDVAAYAGGSPYTAAQQKPAMIALTQAVGSALHAAGYLIDTNTSDFEPGVAGADDGSLAESWWEQIAPNVDGITTEYWAEDSDGSNNLRTRGTAWYQYWDQWVAAAAKFHTAFPNKDFLGVTYGDDAHLTYGRASILKANPNAIFLAQRLDYSDPYGPWVNCPNPVVDPTVPTATCQ